MGIVVMAPIRIQSEANLRHHWATRARRVSGQRDATRWNLFAVARNARPEPPLTITITRIAPRELDSDNLAGGCKAVRDGIADWLCVDDGDKRLTWRYEQRTGKPREYACEIRIEAP